MSLIADHQKLTPGSLIRLIEVDGSDFGADILRFHGHAAPISGEHVQDEQAPTIIWQGETYHAWPYEIEGLEASSDGSEATPTLSAANINGALSALCLAYQDLAQAKVTIHETLAKYLDAANFADGNATADPEQEALDIWFIARKTQEDNQQISWELTSPASVLSKKMGRQMTPYCYWCHRGWYRGQGCGYAGEAMFTEHDQPTDDPAQDRCSGTVKGCELRFGEQNELPFGGQIAVQLLR